MATWGERMSPYLENHSGNPKYHGRHAIEDASFHKRFERSPQDLEQVGKVEPGDPIASNKQDPSDKAGSKHLRRPLGKANNGDQQEQNEEAAGRRVALERIRFETRKPVCRYKSGDHHDIEKSTQVDARPEGGTRVAWLSPRARVRLSMTGLTGFC